MLRAILLISLAGLAFADRNVSVSAADPRLVYFPGVCNATASSSSCAGLWSSVNPINAQDVRHYTSSIPNAACTLTFQGSAIYYITTFQTYDSVADINLDGVSTRGVTWSAGGPVIVPNQTAWSATGLDPTINHTLSIIYSAINYNANTPQPHYLDISGFLYTVPDSLAPASAILPTAITASRPGSTMTGGPARTSMPDNDGSHLSNGNRIAAIVGGVLGGCLLLVLGFLAFLLYRRRKSPNRISIASTAGRAAIDDEGSVSGGEAFPAGRTPLVYLYETPPISPATAMSPRPFDRAQRYSAVSDLESPRPPYANSEQDSSTGVARGSHFGSDEMQERSGSRMGGSMLAHGSHHEQEQENEKTAMDEIATHVTNPDLEGPPSYTRD